MDFGSAGVSTLQQNENTLRQHQHQNERQRQQADCFFDQQLNIETRNDASNLSQPAFVAPEALSSLPRAPPSVISDSSSSSSRGWQHSPASNASVLSSPATSITSPQSNTTTPPIDPAILLNSGEEQKTKPLQTTEPAKTIESPKRHRGRPRLAESKTRDTRVARAAYAAKETPTVVIKTQQQQQQQHQKKAVAAARRLSFASVSGADDFTAENTTDDKKNRIRARNREAAYKCRQKKQKGIEKLQEEEAVAEDINKTLHSEAALLRSEILMLKNMVLQHGGCGCSYIEEYISGAAQNLVHSNLASTTHNAGCTTRNDQQNLAGAEGDNCVDWETFEMDGRPALSALESESGFSGVDEASVAHSSRAQSLGLAMV